MMVGAGVLVLATLFLLLVHGRSRMLSNWIGKMSPKAGGFPGIWCATPGWLSAFS